MFYWNNSENYSEIVWFILKYHLSTKIQSYFCGQFVTSDLLTDKDSFCCINMEAHLMQNLQCLSKLWMAAPWSHIDSYHILKAQPSKSSWIKAPVLTSPIELSFISHVFLLLENKQHLEISRYLSIYASQSLLLELYC